VRGRSYIKLYLGEKQSDVYSAVTHVTDGTYHVIKIVRRTARIEFYVDGIPTKLDGGNSKQIDRHHDVEIRTSLNERLSRLEYAEQTNLPTFHAQRLLRLGNFKNGSIWNGIVAGRDAHENHRR
jgi:hypothetical protein